MTIEKIPMLIPKCFNGTPDRMVISLPGEPDLCAVLRNINGCVPVAEITVWLIMWCQMVDTKATAAELVRILQLGANGAMLPEIEFCIAKDAARA